MAPAQAISYDDRMIEQAIRYDKPIRIGVNWGSLDQALLARLMDENAKRATPQTADAVMREALVASALGSAEQAERLGLRGDRIVLSCKVSSVQDLIVIYRELARRSDYPLHLGLTEAGMGMASSAICLSAGSLSRAINSPYSASAFVSSCSSRFSTTVGSLIF